MMQEGGVILDIVLFVGICFVFGVFDLEIYFWCVVGCYSSTSRKSAFIQSKRPIKTKLPVAIVSPSIFLRGLFFNAMSRLA